MGNWQERKDHDLLDVRDVYKLPDPEWLIEGLVPYPGVTVLYGPSRHGKSFVALAWAAAVAQGKPWHGRPVRQAPVLYIAGEGGRGIKKRISALATDQNIRDRNIPGLYFRLKPLDVAEETQDIVDTFKALDICPGLIVVDTLACAFGGRDENNTGDMQTFVQALTGLSGELGVSCLVIHHTGRASGHERGSTALKSGVDTQFRCEAEMDDHNRIKFVTLSCEKQKDWEEAEPILLSPRKVTSVSSESLVFDLLDKTPGDLPTSGESRIYDILVQYGRRLHGTEWLNLCLDQSISRASFFRWRKVLVDTHQVDDDHGTWFTLN